MNLTTVILAAGKGTRMRSSLPKVLHQLGHKSLLRHVYDLSNQFQDNHIHIIVGHGAEQVQKDFLDDTNIVWTQQLEQLGTGHAVKQVCDKIDDDSTVLILYGDVPLLTYQTLQNLLLTISDTTIGLLTVSLANPKGYGRIIRHDHTGHVERIIEEKDANSAEKRITEVNTGIVAVPGRHLKKWIAQLNNNNAQQEYYLTDIIELAVADHFTVITTQPQTEEEILGVNDKSQLAFLERVYQQRLAKELMLKGVMLRDPMRFDLRGEIVELGQSIEIDINVILEGTNQIGDNVKIGANCIIKNSVIANDVDILPHCIIENAVIGEGSRIGPFARIRPETTLATHTHIGNFVEIKKSSIGDGTKINHLSYIGDSVIGRQVNVGAGTITCNYDGVNKFQTIIEDGAFIGSNTQLVAPVTVGNNATIGAGSTITKDTPPHQLTLSRNKQVSIPHWQRPVKKEKK
jgi:bifunctional UDP-N-acetylglucosamine pyrophosphorylase/glucosamine-1-phosphate N-acetyltransferase